MCLYDHGACRDIMVSGYIFLHCIYICKYTTAIAITLYIHFNSLEICLSIIWVKKHYQPFQWHVLHECMYYSGSRGSQHIYFLVHIITFSLWGYYSKSVFSIFIMIAKLRKCSLEMRRNRGVSLCTHASVVDKCARCAGSTLLTQ